MKTIVDRVRQKVTFALLAAAFAAASASAQGLLIPGGEPLYVRLNAELVIPPGGFQPGPFAIDPFYPVGVLGGSLAVGFRNEFPDLRVEILDRWEDVPEGAPVLDITLTQWAFQGLSGEFRVLFFATLEGNGEEIQLGAFSGRSPLTPAFRHGDFRDFEPAVDEAVERLLSRLDEEINVPEEIAF